ncbi:MAG: hypothetical protein HYS27_10670 [Deltaproteobacteria bacterium]|nr:hypothetical protein [Deltaproteobacteria bacterium]
MRAFNVTPFLLPLALVPCLAATAARAQPVPPVEQCTVTCELGDTCVRCQANEDCAYKCLTLCASDLECDAGEVCEILETACAGCPVDDPLCDPTVCDGVGKCLPTGEDPPAGCASDADCAGGEVCITETWETCTGGGCVCPDDGDGDPSNDPPCDCPPPEEPTCTSETVSFCGPRWLDGCAVDADCGPGFTCEAVELCTCTASSDPSVPEQCSCESSGELTCVLEPIVCEDDADCPDGLVCVEQLGAVPCALLEDGTVECGDGTNDTERLCAPAGFTEQGGVVRAESGTDPAEGEGEDGDQDDDGDDDLIRIDCAQSGAAGALPLATLALALVRRRRARR